MRRLSISACLRVPLTHSRRRRVCKAAFAIRAKDGGLHARPVRDPDLQVSLGHSQGNKGVGDRRLEGSVWVGEVVANEPAQRTTDPAPQRVQHRLTALS